MINSLLTRLTSSPDAATDISLGGAVKAVADWTYVAPGVVGVGVHIEPSTSSMYVSDGAGVAFSALRFRRVDLASGEETGSFRSGTPVRCLTLVADEELIAATDSKLFRLGARGLDERQRWESRIPRYSSSMAAANGRIVVANGIDPKLSVIDLASARIRRLAGPSMPLLVGGGDRIVAIGGDAAGGTVEVDPETATATSLVQTPAALHAWLAPYANDLWLLAGIRFVMSPTSGQVGKASRDLIHYPSTAEDRPVRFRLPKAARGLAGSSTHLWCVGERFVITVPIPLGQQRAGLWIPPPNESISAVDPLSARIVTDRSDGPSASTALTCYRLDLGA